MLLLYEFLGRGNDNSVAYAPNYRWRNKTIIIVQIFKYNNNELSYIVNRLYNSISTLH